MPGALPSKLIHGCSAERGPSTCFGVSPRGLAIVLALMYAGCAGGCERTNRPSSGRLEVMVTIPPQAYFVERIGGDMVEVHVLVGPGQSYHTYEPTPRQVAAATHAKLYFGIGVPFEAALLRKISAANPKLRLVDTREGIMLRPAVGCEHDHTDDSAHDHVHHHEEDGDPHIWLDPRLVKQQARTIAVALCETDPTNAAQYQRNLAAFETDLDAVHVRITSRLAPHRGRSFFVFHPSFGYFGDAYGLTQVSVETSGKEPSARQIAELVRQARVEGVRVIFVQPQFAETSAEAIAREIGGRIVSIDPLARDYLTNLEQMTEKIARALDETRPVERPSDPASH